MKKWLKYFTAIMNVVKTNSPDIHTQVGAVITAQDNSIVSTGYNGLPRKVAHLAERLQRPDKYNWMEHAERNAIYNAARNGVPLKGTVLYVSAPPCIGCTKAIIQSGIAVIKMNEVEWDAWWKKDGYELDDWNYYQAKMLNEANVKVMVL